MDEFLKALSKILEWISFEAIMTHIKERKRQKQSDDLLAFLVELYNILNRIVANGRSIQKSAATLVADPQNLQIRQQLVADIFAQLWELDVVIRVLFYHKLSFFIRREAFDDTYFLPRVSGKSLLLLDILRKVHSNLIYRRVLQYPECLDEEHITEMRKMHRASAKAFFNDNPLDLVSFDLHQFKIVAARLNSKTTNEFLEKISKARDSIKAFIEDKFSIFDVMSSMEHATFSLATHTAQRDELSFYDVLQHVQRLPEEPDANL